MVQAGSILFHRLLELALTFAGCNQINALGIENVYPPLAKSDYLMEDKPRSIRTVINGLAGEIMVNGKTYNIEMTSFDLSDQDVSDVLNYIRNSWGNKGEAVMPEQVAVSRRWADKKCLLTQ